MIRKNNRHYSHNIFLSFSLAMLLAVGTFFVRAVTGSAATPLNDSEIIRLSHEYSLGSVYDRNNRLLVSGSGGKTTWQDAETGEAFSEILGTDIGDTGSSHFTLCGNCPWLFGAQDNRFSLYSLLLPSAPRVGGSVKLTLDSELQKYVQQCINRHGYARAYVVVSNYTTGEILAVKGNAFQDEMSPGSTIKPILAACSLTLDPSVKDYTYECNEQNHVFDTASGLFRIDCFDGELHGEVTMADALAFSCNGYFVSLMNGRVNRDDMLSALKNWGFDSEISYSQFTYIDHDFLNGSTADTDYLLAAIGQANARITPAGLNFCTNALLNHGVLVEPVWFTQKKTSPRAKWMQAYSAQSERKVCDEQAADQVKEMMLGVTEKGTGKSFYLPGFAAKTGTAEKPGQNGDTSKRYTVWATGGLTDEEHPYSITVCLDDVGKDVSSADAGALAKEILTFMTTEENNYG